MRELTFYGSGDDLFEIVGSTAGEPDEVGAGSDDQVIVEVQDAAGAFLVIGSYGIGNTPCWSIAISQVDEDESIAHTFRFSQYKNGYSVQLDVEVDDEAVVTLISPEQDTE